MNISYLLEEHQRGLFAFWAILLPHHDLNSCRAMRALLISILLPSISYGLILHYINLFWIMIISKTCSSLFLLWVRSLIYLKIGHKSACLRYGILWLRYLNKKTVILHILWKYIVWIIWLVKIKFSIKLNR